MLTFQSTCLLERFYISTPDLSSFIFVVICLFFTPWC